MSKNVKIIAKEIFDESMFISSIQEEISPEGN
jgi:hypothetical protein